MNQLSARSSHQCRRLYRCGCIVLPPAQVTAHGTDAKTKKQIGITMFGVTTPGVDAIRKTLEEKLSVETYVFHATGMGGKAMERLINEGKLDAVIDLTTTEVCDYIMDGVMSAGATRLEAAAKAGIPTSSPLAPWIWPTLEPGTRSRPKYEGRTIFGAQLASYIGAIFAG